ncbi:hypothetical protein [Pseudomonas benzenivorans]|uniref:hypothetical protein n=1 Tax=Pseudomonas benzenivorans TaxID=556533 RepID=UPI0035116416
MESWRPLIIRLAIALAYASIFPITNLLGGGIMMIGILISIPFLPIAWIAGMFFVQIFGSETAYLPGAFFAIFIQSLLLACWLASMRKTESNT